jgi:hypothetical protein
MSSSRSASSSAAGGAGKKGGKKVGRAALRAQTKNLECCEEYITRLMAAPTSDTIDEMADDHIFLGRITKNVGCGNVQVLLHNGEKATIPIGGAIRFRGKAANKSDRSNCMLTDDVVVVDGGFAAGKLTARQITQVRSVFKAAHFDVPKGFFCTAGELQDDDAEETGFEFDRTGASAFELEEEEKERRSGGGAGGAEEEYDIDLI